MAVDAFRVVATVVAHAAALVVSEHVQAEPQFFDRLVVVTRFRMTETIARLTLVLVVHVGGPPRSLMEAVAAPFTLIAVRVVLTRAHVLARTRPRILDAVTLGRVPVAHAPAADHNVFDGVKVLHLIEKQKRTRYRKMTGNSFNSSRHSRDA